MSPPPPTPVAAVSIFVDSLQNWARFLHPQVLPLWGSEAFCSCSNSWPFLHPSQHALSTSTFLTSPLYQAASAFFYRIQRIAHGCFLPRPEKSQNQSLFEQKGLPEEFSKCPKASS